MHVELAVMYVELVAVPVELVECILNWLRYVRTDLIAC